MSREDFWWAIEKKGTHIKYKNVIKDMHEADCHKCENSNGEFNAIPHNSGSKRNTVFEPMLDYPRNE